LKDKRQYGKELLFVDNNFATNPGYSKKLLRRMIDENLDYDIMVLARVEIANDPELLALMRQAGITQIFQGYESVQPETLVGYDKHQTVEKIVSAIEKLHDFGFRLSGSFVLGADTDSLDTIRSTVDFVLENKLTIAYFFPLWGHYIEKNNNNSSIIPWYRSIFKGWAYCDGNFVTHFPLLMKPSDLQEALIKAHREIFSPKMIINAFRHREWMNTLEKATHRMMWSKIEKPLLKYKSWLCEIEQEMYDNNGRLCEDRLIERAQRNSHWTFPDPGFSPQFTENSLVQKTISEKCSSL
jgi:radical SAM superfamily enzyme YgiQ (UPF0313 family)